MRSVVVTPVLGVHHVVACEAATLIPQRRVDGFEAAVEPDVVHVALGDPFGDRAGGRDETRGTAVGAGKDNAGSFAAASSRVEPQLILFGA